MTAAPRVLLAGLLCLALTACGSTVQLTSTSQAGSGLAAPDAVAGGGPALGPGGAAAGQPGAGVAAGAVPGTSRALPGRSGAGPTTGPAASRAPVRAGGPVRVGLLYLDGVDKAATALGVSGLSTGDAVAQARAVVGHLNARSGLGGRRIDLRTAKVAATDASSESAWASACASLTQDEKVEYVFSYATLNETRLSCYAKHGVPVLDDQSNVSDSVGARYADLFAAPGELAPGRAAQELVDGLWRTGWLTPASKVGSFVYDTQAGVEVETRYLAPALARHGLSIKVNARTSDGASGADQSGTVLKYQTAGVDRVIPLGASPLFLMQAAETQGYRPRYAITSTFGPGALLESAAPKAQLEGARGIGWSKYLDIGAGTRPGPVSSNETLCLQIMKQADQQSTSATTQAFQVALCNVLLVLKSGSDAHGLSPALLPQLRAERFSPKPADAYAIRFQPGRADAAAAYRDLAYDASCACFQYTSGNRPTR